MQGKPSSLQDLLAPRAVRVAHGLSPRTVAQRSAIGPGHLSKVERGENRHFGAATVRVCVAWRRRFGCTGGAADRIPGKASLTNLACARGFTVTS